MEGTGRGWTFRLIVSGCLLITVWFHVDHLGKHKECGKCVCVCVCVCFTSPEFYLGNQKWEESVVGILKDPTRPREEKNSPFSSSAPLRS